MGRYLDCGNLLKGFHNEIGPMEKVNLFISCLLDTLFPDTAQAVIDVLEHLGRTVHIPKGQTCCGQPAFNAGFWDEARDVARYTMLICRRPAPYAAPTRKPARFELTFPVCCCACETRPSIRESLPFG
jgi:hypothetical protein